MKQQNPFGKRAAIIGLALFMTAGCIPLRQAYALPAAKAYNMMTQTQYSDVQTALNSAKGGDTIQLTADVDIGTSGSALIYDNANMTVTFDLNGHHLIRQAPAGMLDGGDGATIQISSGTLNIEDDSSGAGGSIRLRNATNSVGSAVNIGSAGTLNLRSGSLLGDGQGIFAYEAGGRFDISGGLVYGSADTGSSEGIAATTGVHGSISGGYIGTKNPGSAMIFSASPLNADFWSITGGYFTSDSYRASQANSLAEFVKPARIVKLDPPAAMPLSGATPFAYTISLLPQQKRPDALLDPLNEVLTGLEPGAAYTVDRQPYEADADGKLPLDPNWIAATIGIVQKGAANVTADSEKQTLTIPARPAAPAVTADDLFDEIAGASPAMEYRIDAGSWTAYAPTNPPQLSGDHQVEARYRAVSIPAALSSEITALTFAKEPASAGYKVTGVAAESDGAVRVSGANVRLYEGSAKIGEAAVTDAKGRFVLSGVPNGTYSLVVDKNDRVSTFLVVVKGQNYDFGGETLLLPSGGTNSRLAIKGADTPNVAVGGLTELFRDTQYSFLPADRQTVDEGGTVNISLEVEKKSEAAADGTSAIRALADGQTIRTYLDMTLLKKTVASNNQSSVSTIPTTGSLLQIVVPYDSSGQKNVTVYRYHDGAAQRLTPLPYGGAVPATEGYEVGPDGDRIVIWSRHFSTYAIADGIPVPPVGGSNHAGGGSSASGVSASIPAAEVSVSIRISASAGGSVSPSGLLSVTKGSSRTLTFAPDPGYRIQDVRVDGKSLGAVTAYTLAGIVSDHEIQAIFVRTDAAGPDALPYYMDGDRKVFIGFAAPIDGVMTYIAPSGKEISFGPNPRTFSDLNGHWAAEAAAFAAERELFLGIGNDEFAPNESMTRAMFASVLDRLYERSYGKTDSAAARGFADVKPGAWYADSVDRAARQGIVQGVDADSFEPNRAITRQEMAVMLYRFSALMHANDDTAPTSSAVYADAADIAAWAAPAVDYFRRNGVIEGRAGSLFAPNAIAERAEAAAVLQRFIETTVKQIAL